MPYILLESGSRLLQEGGAAGLLLQEGSAPTPTGTPAVTGIGYQFDSPIVATGLAIVVTVVATGATVPATVSYDDSTYLASFIPSATTPLLAGTKYLISVSGATAPDGTPMVPAAFAFHPGGVAGRRWAPRLGRPAARLLARP